MITVQPIQPHERRHCVYCEKALQPSGPGLHQMLVKNFADASTPEEQLAAFKTNRRVVRVKRHWYPERDDDDKVIGRRVSRIDLTFMPDDPRDWGYDGLFCTAEHARLFAHAAYRAGYRIKSQVTKIETFGAPHSKKDAA
jgi:hypothetical protein